VDPISDGPGSSDEYVPPPENRQESPEDQEETFDPSDDDTPAAASKPRKKKQPKGALRKAVEDERAKLAGHLAEEKGSTGKRKDPPFTAAHVISRFFSC
jgi:hypothetical protein